MQLILVRHARPHHVHDASAVADPSLTDEGQQQAARLAEAFAGGGHGDVTAIVSSTMRRAQETAAPLAKALGLPVTTDERIVELDRGWSSYGMEVSAYNSRAEAFAALNGGRWGTDTYDPAAFSARVVAGMEDQIARHPDGKVVVVCHGGVISAYVAAIVGADRPILFTPDYTSVTRVLALPDGHRELLGLNLPPTAVAT